MSETVELHVYFVENLKPFLVQFGFSSAKQVQQRGSGWVMQNGVKVVCMNSISLCMYSRTDPRYYSITIMVDERLPGGLMNNIDRNNTATQLVKDYDARAQKNKIPLL